MHTTTAVTPTSTGPPRTPVSRGRAAAHSVPANVNTAVAESAARSAKARL